MYNIQYLSAFCLLVCIGVVSFNGGLHMTNGDILTVLSGIPGAVNIVVSALACKDKNVLLLTTIELWVVTIFPGSLCS